MWKPSSTTVPKVNQTRAVDLEILYNGISIGLTSD